MEKRFFKRLHDSVNYSLNNLYVNNDDNKMSNNKQQPRPENPNNQFSNTEPLTHAQRIATVNTMSNNKIKHLLDTAYKTDAIAKNKLRIENREQLREQRKKELKELMEKDNTMSNNKQSSVEWLHHEFERIDKEFHVGTYEYNYAKNLAFKISKAMHKEEIIAAKDDNYVYGEAWEKLGTLGEQYYNETFGGKNE